MKPNFDIRAIIRARCCRGPSDEASAEFWHSGYY